MRKINSERKKKERKCVKKEYEKGKNKYTKWTWSGEHEKAKKTERIKESGSEGGRKEGRGGKKGGKEGGREERT